MLGWLKDRHNLIGAREYLYKFENSILEESDICLSFDDALLCQYEIALPILKKHNLDAFFFVYSSVFTGNPDNLEVYRHFRMNNFSDVDDFYSQFFALAETKLAKKYFEYLEAFQCSNFLEAYPFYSENDKWFRYLRDRVLNEKSYGKLMQQLMDAKKFSTANIVGELWMSERNLKSIFDLGHIVGLHSHSHPTSMSRLSYKDQLKEYTQNFEYLQGVLGSVEAMSHPCGDYNNDTLEILSHLGIKIGFRSNMSEMQIKSRFEVPREDHATVYKNMQL